MIELTLKEIYDIVYTRKEVVFTAAPHGSNTEYRMQVNSLISCRTMFVSTKICGGGWYTVNENVDAFFRRFGETSMWFVQRLN